ncbi:MAG: hypothetical protein AB2L11_13030 [Syntrophobacteraceae bacterium]
MSLLLLMRTDCFLPVRPSPEGAKDRFIVILGSGSDFWVGMLASRIVDGMDIELPLD